MAGLKAIGFLCSWLIWVAMIPFLLTALLAGATCQALDPAWEPWHDLRGGL